MFSLENHIQMKYIHILILIQKKNLMIELFSVWANELDLDIIAVVKSMNQY